MRRKSPYLPVVLTVTLVTVVGAGIAGAAVLGPSADTASQVDGEDARVRVVHASPDAPPVDVSVDGEVVAASLAFGEEASVSASAGDHTIEIAAAANETAADNESTVLFSENVTLEAGTDYTIAAAGEVTEGAPTAFEPIVLAENATEVEDDRAAVGLVHLSPDAPAVDVTDNATGEVVFENVAYRNATEQVVLPAGDYTLDVRVESESNDGEIVEGFDVSIEGGSTYTAFAIGYAAAENVSEEQAFTLLLSNDAGEGMNETEMPTEAGTTTEAPPDEGTATESPTMTPET